MRQFRVFPRWRGMPVVRDRFKVTHWASAPCFAADKVAYCTDGTVITCLWCMRAWR